MQDAPKSLGRIAFEAYNAHGPNAGKTHDGRLVPAWEDMTDDVRSKWEAAAVAVKAQAELTIPIPPKPKPTKSRNDEEGDDS